MAKKKRTKKRRRKLKKWVIPVLILLLIVTALLIVIKNISKGSEKKVSNYKDNKVEISNNKNEVNESSNESENAFLENEDLNRIVFKDGFYYEELSDDIRKEITGVTFPIEFDENYSKVDYEDLRYVIVKYFDFNGKEHKNGEMIVHKLVAQDVVEIFYELYQNRYPIEKMVLVDKYDGDDELSMQDNNTSCFNYRIVENIDRLAWHAFGLAIDVNPLYNPYIVGDTIYPSTAGEYVNRNADFVGKIDHDDLAYKIFTKYGWKWGGDFAYTKDYQHFYKEALDGSIRERKN